VRSRTPRVHDAFRNSLMVKVKDFFPKDEILEKSWAARSSSERVLVIGNTNALIRREMVPFFEDCLVGLAALTDRRLKIFAFCHVAPLLWKSLSQLRHK
jgi:hypothetical protein